MTNRLLVSWCQYKWDLAYKLILLNECTVLLSRPQTTTVRPTQSVDDTPRPIGEDHTATLDDQQITCIMVPV